MPLRDRFLPPQRNDGALADLRTGVNDFLSGVNPGPGLVSLTLPLPGDFVPPLPDGSGEHRYLSQPESGFHLLGVENAVRLRTAGPGRFATLSEFLTARAPGWRRFDPEGTDMAPRAFLGFAFGTAKGPVSAADLLPNAELAVPRLLLQVEGGRAAATFTGTLRHEADALRLRDAWLEAAERGLASTGDVSPTLPVALRRMSSAPDDATWLARARQAVTDIRAGKMEKVVLTRRIRVAAEGDLPPAPVLARLAERHAACTLFAFGNGPVTAVGASPERLVSLESGVVEADALAGTLARGHEGSEDATLGAELLASEKEGHEHRLVVEAMAAALAPTCTELHYPDRPQLMRLSSLQHLRTPITARAKEGVTLLDLVARLHPTPAVGGSPNRVAQDWLAREGESRLGWYTGGVGWVSPEGDGEVSVVLRCAALTGNTAVLSAGAGIVAASDPETELAETELKLQTMLDALGGTGE